jgi:hypothetical protein
LRGYKGSSVRCSISKTNILSCNFMLLY